MIIEQHTAAAAVVAAAAPRPVWSPARQPGHIFYNSYETCFLSSKMFFLPRKAIICFENMMLSFENVTFNKKVFFCVEYIFFRSRI